MKKALILVDIQNDFCPGGALAVPEGDQVVAVANKLSPQFDLVIATQDWHPANHGSFAVNHSGKQVYDLVELSGLEQVLWPSHCVQGSTGAMFHQSLNLKGAHVFQKGTDPQIDSYSGFFDNGHSRATGLGEFLSARGVSEVVVSGLATDYCVKFTVLDALALGYSASVVTDGCRAVNINPGDGQKALDELAAAGCNIISSNEIV